MGVREAGRYVGMAGGTGIGCLLVLVLGGCGGQEPVDDTLPDRETPGVEMLAPGVLSTEAPEFATTLTPDGDTVFFNRAAPGLVDIELLRSVRVGGVWQEPEIFAPLAALEPIDPFVTLGGNRLFISSRAPTGFLAEGSDNLWMVERTIDGWGTPVPLPRPMNSDSSDIYTSLTAAGELFFSSTRGGERRIYSAPPVGDGWGEPVLLELGDIPRQGNPAVSPDGELLVFAATGPLGGADLFVACREGTGWRSAILLPEPINSRWTEFAPGIAGETLYFTSERPGMVESVPEGERPPGDLYRTELGAVRALCTGAPGG